jgi:hypothetical protein
MYRTETGCAYIEMDWTGSRYGPVVAFGDDASNLQLDICELLGEDSLPLITPTLCSISRHIYKPSSGVIAISDLPIRTFASLGAALIHSFHHRATVRILRLMITLWIIDETLLLSWYYHLLATAQSVTVVCVSWLPSSRFIREGFLSKGLVSLSGKIYRYVLEWA